MQIDYRPAWRTLHNQQMDLIVRLLQIYHYEEQRLCNENTFERQKKKKKRRKKRYNFLSCFLSCFCISLGCFLRNRCESICLFDAVCISLSSICVSVVVFCLFVEVVHLVVVVLCHFVVV